MLRRTIATLATTAAVAIAIAAPAGADAPKLDSYAAGSTGTALELSLLGQSLAVSQTQAAVNNGPKASADGAALLLAGTPVPGAAPSSAPGGPATAKQCPIDEDLAEVTQGQLSGLRLQIACLETSAAVTNGEPQAQSGSGEVTIRILGPGGELLAPILAPALEGVTSVTDPLVEALAPILGPIKDATQIDVPNVVDQLTGAIGDDTFVLAEIVVAPTLSQASASSADGVVARAGSNGVTINILPGVASTLAQLTDLVQIPNPSTGPLLQVKLGAAKAEVVRDPVTGEARPDASAAQLLSVKADDALGILGDIGSQLTGAVDTLAAAGAPLSCQGGALADVICIDLGSVNELDAAELKARNLDFGEGTVGREASAASVRLLAAAADALGGDVLGLSLARATAAANAAPAVTPAVVQPPAPESPRSLPRTGGDSALPLTLALLAVGAAGATLVRRSRVA